MRHEPFFGSRGPRNAPVVVIGEAWGVEEAIERRPFVGAAGKEFTKMFYEAGLDLDQCLCLNIVPERPADYDNDFKHFLDPQGKSIRGVGCSERLLDGLERLDEELRQITPSLIIAAGNYPLWALSSVTRTTKVEGTAVPTGIMDYRGSQLYRIGTGTPLLPVIHPAAILRNWSGRSTTVHDLSIRVPLALRGQWSRTPGFSIDAFPSFGDLCSRLRTWRANGADLAIDIETKGSKIITCLGLAWSANDAIVIPFVKINDDKTFTSYWSPEEEATIWALLGDLFVSPKVSFIGQYFFYDLAFIHSFWGVVPRLRYDTYIGQNLLFPGSQRDLGFLSSIYCNHHRYWKDDNREWDDTGSLEQHLLYNGEDVCRTFEIAAEQQHHLKEQDLWRHWDFELHKFWLAWRMTSHGIAVDRDKRKRMALQLFETQMELARLLGNAIPQSVVLSSTDKAWFASAKQTGEVLYDLLGLPEQFDRKSGKRTTGDEALRSLMDSNPFFAGFLQMILDFRSMRVLYGALQAPLEVGDRMSSLFNSSGTKTFRWSSSENPFGRGTNMQNVSAGSEE